MIRINLLPYRSQRRQRQILEHLAVLFGVILITSIGIIAVDLIKTTELTILEDEFSTLKVQNDVLKKKIGKIRDLDKLRTDVEKKLAIVDTLQKGRFHSLVTLRELADAIPENVWLTSVVDAGETLSINGFGESNKAVANFMRSLDESAVFSNIVLKTITRSQSGSVPVRQFGLTMSRVEPKSPDDVKKPGEGA